MSFLQTLNESDKHVGAVILAGGLARRMGGVDKGLVEIAGRAMTSWVIDTVRPTVHKLIINANRNHDAYSALGCPVVADRHTGHIGPLAGLSAAIHHLDTDYVFMCPCDSPFINAALVDRLGAACIEQDNDVAVAHDGERAQPVFCMVHSRTIESLDAYLDSGERKIDKWYATQNTKEVDCSSLTKSFRNINTEVDRIAAIAELSI